MFIHFICFGKLGVNFVFSPTNFNRQCILLINRGALNYFFLSERDFVKMLIM